MRRTWPLLGVPAIVALVWATDRPPEVQHVPRAAPTVFSGERDFDAAVVNREGPASEPEHTSAERQLWIHGTLRTSDGTTPKQALSIVAVEESAGPGSDPVGQGVVVGGRFFIRVVKNTRYRLLCSSQFFHEEVIAEGGANVEIVLEPGCGVGGRVVDASQEPRRPLRHSSAIGIPNKTPFFLDPVLIHVRFEAQSGESFEGRGWATNSEFSFRWRRPAWWTAETALSVRFEAESDTGNEIPMFKPVSPGTYSVHAEVPVIPRGSGARPFRFRLKRAGDPPLAPPKDAEEDILSLASGYALTHRRVAWFFGEGGRHRCYAHAELEPNRFSIVVPAGRGRIEILAYSLLPVATLEIGDEADLSEHRWDLPAPGRLALHAPRRPQSELHNLVLRKKGTARPRYAPVRFWHWARRGVKLAPGVYVLEHIPSVGPEIVTYVQDVVIRSGETTTLRLP